MLVAGAFAAIAAIAAPAYAQNAATPATPQARPAPSNGAEPAGEGRQGGEPSPHGGGWGMRGGAMMHPWMRRREMARSDPQERCIDRLAWRAARRAYVEAKLDLTAAQRPLWDKVQGIAQAELQKERQLCGQLQAGEESTVLDRMDRAQQFLSAKLDALQSARPAVQALYQSLSPEQREIFDHPFPRD
jgi:hypothetical protein